jgi:hypothetical protein
MIFNAHHIVSRMVAKFSREQAFSNCCLPFNKKDLTRKSSGDHQVKMKKRGKTSGKQ